MLASALRRAFVGAGLLVLAAVSTGCCGITGTCVTPRSALAEKWLKRAADNYKVGDIQEAHDSIQKALGIVPDDEEVKTLAGRIALARLDFSEALRMLKGIKGSEQAGLRGRAHWYQGSPDQAADELEAMLEDPDVRDDWAKSIAKLARRGAGKRPFRVTEGFYGYDEMIRVHPEFPYFIVPVEIDGQQAFAAIMTGQAEVVLDSATRAEPSWITMRFGHRLELTDVPALVQDLSGISKQMGGAPIRALLGVNLLRHVNATIDFYGRQFVARAYAPPQPPEATRLDTFYMRGGGMVLRTQLGEQPASFLVDTSSPYPLSLDLDGWKKAGVDTANMQAIPGSQTLRAGVVPKMKLGALDIPQVPGVFGGPIADIEKQLSLDIDGTFGCGLLAFFRVTFAEEGRYLWVEDSLASLASMYVPPVQGPPMQGPPVQGPPASPLPPKLDGKKPGNEKEAPKKGGK